MDQEKFYAARIDYPISYKEAFDRVMTWTNTECRLILFGLLMGFPVGQSLKEIGEIQSFPPPVPDPVPSLDPDAIDDLT